MRFQPGTVVLAKRGSFKGVRDGLLNAIHTFNTTVIGYGAVLRMRKLEYMNRSSYTFGATRGGVNLFAAAQVKLLGLHVEDCGGDGLIVMREESSTQCAWHAAGYWPSCPPWSRDVEVVDCIFDRGYRTGLALISVVNMLVVNTTFSNTWGASPANGIDIEPDHPTFRLENITFTDVRCMGNSGAGLEISPTTLNSSSAPLSIWIDGLTIDGASSLPEPIDSTLPAKGNQTFRWGAGLAFTSHLYPQVRFHTR